MTTSETTGILAKVRQFKSKYPDVYEFIMFNLLSNVATITNFLFLWLGTGFLFKAFSGTSFQWFIFNYKVSDGGLGGFLSFLLAYIMAQIVNFYVQKNFVFDATVDLKKSLPWYVLTVTVAGIISIWLPPYVISLVSPYVKGFAPTLANIVNIVVQVVINYPMMKFVIMKKEK